MLIYVGNGWIPGVPARDLAEDEIHALSERFDDKGFRLVLVNSGLYVEETGKKEHRVKFSPESLEDKEV